MKNNLIYLVTPSRTQTQSGFYVETYQRREIFAEVKTATRSEHYSAERAGKRVQLTVIVNDMDYQFAVIDEGEDASQAYDVKTTRMDGSVVQETITPHIKREPEYVEIDAVRYRIERNFKKPASMDRELTLSMAD